MSGTPFPLEATASEAQAADHGSNAHGENIFSHENSSMKVDKRNYQDRLRWGIVAQHFWVLCAETSGSLLC